MFRRMLAPTLSGLLIGLLCSTAWGFSVNVRQFSVIRDGVPFFLDTFSDGLEPPSSPGQGPGMLSGCGSSCYFVAGSFPDGSEAGNRLRLDTANGVETANARGVPVFSQRATLLLSTTPAVNQGLQAHRTFEVSALFDLVIPTTPGDVYSVVLADRASGNTMNDYVQVQVANAGGNPVIRFRRQDFVADTITLIDSDPISAAHGDQVRLILSHPSADTDTIVASYEFFQGGVSQGIVAMSGNADIYTGEIWTRPEFSIASVVPEPETYLLMALGLALVGGFTGRARQRGLRFI